MEPCCDIKYSDKDILNMICRDKCGAKTNDFYVENCPNNHNHCYHCKERFYKFAIEMFPVKEVEIENTKYLEVMGAHLLKSKMDGYVRFARHRARTEQYFKDLPKEEKKCWKNDQCDMLQRKLHKELVSSVGNIDYFNDMARPMIAMRAIIENYVDEQVFTKDGKIRRN